MGTLSDYPVKFIMNNIKLWIVICWNVNKLSPVLNQMWGEWRLGVLLVDKKVCLKDQWY